MTVFRSRRAQALALLATVTVLFLPFIHRAYFVDDYYFVTMARGILDHPLRPYDFRSDDAGKDNPAWERGQPPRMVNPPLFHYYLAAVMRICGDAPSWLLRLSMLPFAWIAVLSMFVLGRHFVRDPFGAALLFSVTPIFWLTSYSLLIDAMLIAWVLAGLVVCVRAFEKRSVGYSILCGVFMGAAILTKYFGVIGIGLVFLWQMLDADRRRWRGGYSAYVVCAAMLLGWTVWTIQAYGESHLLASLARGVKADQSLLFYLYKGISVASFLGGGSVFLLEGFPLLWNRSRMVFLAVLLGMGGFFALFRSPAGGFSAETSLQLMLWIGSVVAFLSALMLKPLQKSQWFLSGWLILGLLELMGVMPWVAGRYFLCVLPAVVWLAWQNIEDRVVSRVMWVSLTAIVGLFAAFGDLAQANTLPKVAKHLSSLHPAPTGTRHFYLADTFSGFAAYLPVDWQSAFPNQDFQKGDRILISHYRRSAWWQLPPELKLTLLDRVAYPSRLPIRVMDIPASAGWYASVWGALPFALSRNPLEEYRLYEVTETRFF